MHICVEPLEWRCGLGTDRRGEGSHRVYRELRYAFGRQVLTLRTRVALTQSGLAEATGVHRRSVQNWETGESYPKAETLQRLIAVFLARGLFIPGQETEEAAQLWQQASQDAPHPLAAFDAAWFARLLAAHSAMPPRPTQATHRWRLPAHWTGYCFRAWSPFWPPISKARPSAGSTLPR